MNELLTELVSGTVQIVAFSILPFVVFIIQNKRARGFFINIGLHKTTSRAVYLSIGTSLFFVGAALTLVSLNGDVRETMTNPPSITGKLRQMGLNPISIITLLVVACFKTSLAEEIFFRGFVAKRLMKWLGFFKGNLVQSILFAAIHFLLFLMVVQAGYVFLIFIFALTGIGAFLIGYTNEKIGNRSIVPGWIAHGLGNTVSYAIIAFAV